MRVTESRRPFGVDVESVTKWLNNPRLALPFLILFAAILRLPNLGESLWYDEVHYSTRYLTADLSGLWQFLANDPSAPLYPILSFLWTGLVAETELLVRTPSLVFGLASIALTYHIASTTVS